MDDFDTKDTIPAMPVPSTNPHAKERKVFEEQVRVERVSVFEIKPSVFIGLLNAKGVAERYTPEMTEDVAQQWLSVAQLASAMDAWIPEVCARCLNIMSTPGLCGHCIRGRR